MSALPFGYIYNDITTKLKLSCSQFDNGHSKWQGKTLVSYVTGESYDLFTWVYMFVFDIQNNNNIMTFSL